MKNFYVILIVVSVVAGLALGYGIWGKDKASFEKLQKVMAEKEVSYSRTLAESEELRNISEELRGKISGLETDNHEFKDILRKIDELIDSKVGHTAASVAPESEAVPAPADAVPANAAPAIEDAASAAIPEPEAVAEPVEPVPANAVPANAVPANAVPADAAPIAVEPTAEIETAPVVSEPEPVTDAGSVDAASVDAASVDAASADAGSANAGPANAALDADVDKEPEFTMPSAPVELAPAEGMTETETTSESEVEKTDTDPMSLTPVPELKSEHLPVKDVI